MIKYIERKRSAGPPNETGPQEVKHWPSNAAWKEWG